LGNHDLWVDESAVARALTAAGVRLLENDSVRLPAPYDDVWLCGLDDPGGGEPDAAAALAGADGVRVVLMHSPEGLSALSDRRFDVALCGHTHGGQIVWPSGRPIWVPPGSYNRAYPHGRFVLDGDHRPALLVSRGVGYGSLPLRLFAPSDVLLVTLRWREKTALG
jgi:predicted MPP superfamily phosphohydrolase